MPGGARGTTASRASPLMSERPPWLTSRRAGSAPSCWRASGSDPWTRWNCRGTGPSCRIVRSRCTAIKPRGGLSGCACLAIPSGTSVSGRCLTGWRRPSGGRAGRAFACRYALPPTHCTTCGRSVSPHVPLSRYLTWTVGDALRRYGLRDDVPLVGLLAMLIEDTVHATVDSAPLINAALGITIRGAGLSRAAWHGCTGFWRVLVARYREVGGSTRAGCEVSSVDGAPGSYRITTRLGAIDARRVVSAVPAATTERICAGLPVARRLRPFLERDARVMGARARSSSACRRPSGRSGIHSPPVAAGL